MGRERDTNEKSCEYFYVTSTYSMLLRIYDVDVEPPSAFKI